jgi:hypothetical protein
MSMVGFHELNFLMFSVEMLLALVANDVFFFSVITVIKMILGIGRLR